MGKNLIIKGADFSNSAIGEVTYKWMFGYDTTPNINVFNLAETRSGYYVVKSGILYVKKVKIYCSDITYGRTLKIVKGYPLLNADETSDTFEEEVIAEITANNGVGWYEYTFEEPIELLEYESIGVKTNRTGHEDTDQLAGFGQYSTTTLPGTDVVELTNGVYLNKHFIATNAMDLYIMQ